jgi:histidine phosphotransfer protein HptB
MNSFIDTAASELGVEPQEYLEIAEEFLEDVGRRLKSLAQALQQNQAEDVRKIAHTIKGGASQMLLDDIAEPAARIEQAAEQGDLAGADGAVEAIRIGLEKLRTIVKAASTQ